MAKKLCFEWALNEQANCIDEITQDKINKQKEKLDIMLLALKEKLKETFGVSIFSYRHIDCNGKYIATNKKDNILPSYSVNNRMEIIIEKVGRKTTWNDIYKIVNSIQAPKYNFI